MLILTLQDGQCSNLTYGGFVSTPTVALGAAAHYCLLGGWEELPVRCHLVTARERKKEEGVGGWGGGVAGGTEEQGRNRAEEERRSRGATSDDGASEPL